MDKSKIYELLTKMAELSKSHDRVPPCKSSMTEREFNLYMTGISRGGSQAYDQAIKIIEKGLSHERD